MTRCWPLLGNTFCSRRSVDSLLKFEGKENWYSPKESEMRISAIIVRAFLFLLKLNFILSAGAPTRTGAAFIIKNGNYHVSLLSIPKLFLSDKDPALILTKYSDDTIRNEKGDKCLISFDSSVFLAAFCEQHFKYDNKTSTYRLTVNGDLLCWEMVVAEIKLTKCVQKSYGFIEVAIPEQTPTPSPSSSSSSLSSSPTPTSSRQFTPTPTSTHIVSSVSATSQRTESQSLKSKAAQPIQEIFPTSYLTNILFTGKRFMGHVSKKIQVQTVERCFMVCLECIQAKSACHCSSFNIKRPPTKSSSSLSCEINDSNHREVPRDLIEGAEYQYYEVM